jgi:hypothetical protein
LFITIGDETGIANGIIWPGRFEAQRRTVMSAAMIGMKGRVQKEGGVIHVICDRIVDHTALLRSVGEMAFPHRTSAGDGAAHGASPDRGQTGSRSRPGSLPSRLSVSLHLIATKGSPSRMFHGGGALGACRPFKRRRCFPQASGSDEAQIAYYHRDMRGSWSLKAVLPTIAADLAYDTLVEVKSGTDAQVGYVEAIDPATTPARREAIRSALSDYCRRDSEAMMVVLDRLCG